MTEWETEIPRCATCKHWAGIEAQTIGWKDGYRWCKTHHNWFHERHWCPEWSERER